MTWLSPLLTLVLSAWVGYLSLRVHRLERQVEGVETTLIRAADALELIVRLVTRALDSEAEGDARAWER